MINTDIRNYIDKNFSFREYNLLEEHLLRRHKHRDKRAHINIVYDIIKECNLRCKGCAVVPRYVDSSNPIREYRVKPTVDKVIKSLQIIKKYCKKYSQTCFINYGGGEPFLREDFKEIVMETVQLFGRDSVGVDTNGTVNGQYERIMELASNISYLGVSLDGLAAYHNWWRGGDNKCDYYNRTLLLIKQLALEPSLKNKIEVSTLITKRNIKDIPILMEILCSLGINKYSIHRAMQVGRMKKLGNIIPNAQEYLDLLVVIVKKANELKMKAHLHHSIESIYTTMLFGIETYIPNTIGNPDRGSSLGIDPNGNLVFDPWCMNGAWRQLNGGNLFDPEFSLDLALNVNSDNILELAKQFTAPQIRCRGCKLKCAGGNRIAAASNHLNRYFKHLDEKSITVSHILNAMVEIDPACPLYDSKYLK